MIPAHVASWALNRRKSSEEPRVAVVATQLTTVTKKQRKRKPEADDTPVLETKGGGGYVPPPTPTPQEQAQARDWEAAQQEARDQKRQDAIDAKAAQDKAAADAAWTGSKNAAFQGALSSGENRLNAMGLSSGDQYGVYDQFTNRLNTANMGLQTGSDYSSAFAPSILDEILGSSRSSQRNKYQSAFSSQIDPYYAENTFGSTRDDAILNSILQQQYDDAAQGLSAAHDRGQANDIVYQRALKDLDTSKLTANNELQGIGRGVLEGITGDINKRRQSSLDNAAAWDFGTTYDPTQEADRIRSYAGERGSQLEGDVRGAVGGKEFFDINSLLGKATARVGNQTTPTALGSTGTGTSALYDTFANEAKRSNDSTRSNEGIF